MSDRVKNLIIGIFVTGAITVLIAMILFFKPSVGDGKQTITVRFANITGISVGTRVTYAGKPVGEVTHIKELPNARENPDETGRIFLYELTLKVDSSAAVYNTDEIAVKTTGLMGEKSVAILPKAGPKAERVTHQVIYANSVDALENTFSQLSKVANRIESTVGHIDQWFLSNEKSITHLLTSAGGTFAHLEEAIPTFHETSHLCNDNLKFIRSSLDDDKLLHKIAMLAEKLQTTADTFNTDGANTLRNVNQITRNIASGNGTVGRLLAADDMYLRMTSLMNKCETLMNDINHYGILFQYNKSWQKGRTRKANFVKALDTPQEFRNYFEGEIDTMTTSVGRLVEVMNRANGPDRDQIIESPAFKRDFANLLRQVQGLTDSLKLYNESLITQKE